MGEVDRRRPAVGRGDLGPGRPVAVEHEPVDAVAGEQAGTGGLGPREVRLGHAAPAAVAGVRSARVVHPPRDLVVAPAERRRAAPERLTRRRVGAGNGLHGELPLDLVADRVQVAGVEIADAVAGAPTVDDLLRGAAVEPAVDLGATSGAAPLGIGDRRAAEGDGDAAGPVLAVHLLERERDHLALADERPFLEDEHVEPGLGEDGCRRRSAGPRPDDEHLRTQCCRHAGPPSAHRSARCPATNPRHGRGRANERAGRSRRRTAPDAGPGTT